MKRVRTVLLHSTQYYKTKSPPQNGNRRPIEQQKKPTDSFKHKHGVTVQTLQGKSILSAPTLSVLYKFFFKDGHMPCKGSERKQNLFCPYNRRNTYGSVFIFIYASLWLTTIRLLLFNITLYMCLYASFSVCRPEN